MSVAISTGNMERLRMRQSLELVLTEGTQT